MNADSIRVLRVGDEREVSERTAEYLSREDERLIVETANTADAALERLDDETIDCIVSDYDLSNLDGIAFLRAIREENPELPFILLTGKGSEVIASEAISAGVTDYLQKKTGTSQYGVLANRVRNAVDAHRDQREIEASALQVRRYYRRITDGFFAIDGDWRYTFVNEEGARLVGKSVSEMVGARIWDVFPELEGTPFAEALRATMRTGETTAVEAYYPPHGSWYDVRVYPAEEGISIYFRDVTDKEERRRELEETTRQLDAVLNTVDSAIFMKDMDGRYLLLNHKAREILGLGEDETVLGETDYEFFPDELAARYRDGDQRAFEAGETIRIEEPVPTPNGTRTHLTLKSPIFDRAGEPHAVCAVSTDITEQKEREDELEAQNDRLEQFAKVVSHDLRNPLNVAMGRVELARKERPGGHLDEAVRALGRMGELIEDLLTSARDGAQLGDHELIDLATMARRCWEQMDVEDASLVIETDIRVLADRNRLKQLLENFFRNAVEHGGRAVTVTIGDLDDGFYLEDDGPGIPPTVRDRVFEFGYSTNVGGTGLGLSIVSAIVDAHGWAIRVSEGTDGGARFDVSGIELEH